MRTEEKIAKMKLWERENMEKRHEYRRAAMAKENKREKVEEVRKYDNQSAFKRSYVADNDYRPAYTEEMKPVETKRQRSKEEFAVPSSDIATVENEVALLTAKKLKFDSILLNMPPNSKSIAEKRRKKEIEDVLERIEKDLSNLKLNLREMKLNKKNRIARVI